MGGKKRRVIVRIEVGPMGRDTRLIVTSLTGHRSKYLYEKIYCARGQAENYIKSWKRHLASDRTSCSKANANQMRLMIHHCAYWLMWTLCEPPARNVRGGGEPSSTHSAYI